MVRAIRTLLGFLALVNFLNAASPALPTVYLDSTYVPPTGNSLALSSGGDLQAALNSAQYGDEIVLAAGATFTGHFLLPAKTGTGWITIRSSNLASLPAAGTRVSPSNSAAMAKIVTSTIDPAIANDTNSVTGTHNYRLLGLEITMTPTNPGVYSIVVIDTTGSTAASLPATSSSIAAISTAML